MKRENFKTIKDLIDIFLDQNGLREGLLSVDIIKSFHKNIGLTLSQSIINVKYSKGNIFCKVESSVLRNELFMSRESIKNRINSDLGEEYVKHIIIK